MFCMRTNGRVALIALALSLASWGDTFSPANAQMFRLLRDDGDEQMFARDEDEPRALVGEGGWMGELRGADALLLSADERQGLYFVNGILRKRLVNGREIPVRAIPSQTGDAAIKAFWPPKESRLKAGTAPEDYWADAKRLRLWFKNPNLAGGLMALSALFALGLLFLRKWPLKIVGAAMALAFLALLVKTESRAAMLAFGFGCGLVALVRIKSLLSWKVLVPLFLCVGLFGGYMALQKNSSRFTTEMFKEGSSSLSRVPIWMEVPRMIADAPGGWGVGNSGKAYIRWYQDKSTCLLENLVSGHCTFLVEHGWWLRFAYLFLWVFSLLVLFRVAWHGRNPMPFAVVGAFALMGMFHPAIYAWELWVLPILSCAAIVLKGLNWRHGIVSAWIAGGVATLLCIGILAEGKWCCAAKKKIPISCQGDATSINSDRPELWVVDDDYVLHGGYWWLMGKEMRDWCAHEMATRSVGHTFSLQSVPDSCKRLVVVGEACETFCREWHQFGANHKALTDVTLLSPPFSAESISGDIQQKCKLRIIQGGIVARIANYKAKPENLKIVAGASLYIPNWLDEVLPHAHDTDSTNQE